jgi:hypothetical protein
MGLESMRLRLEEDGIVALFTGQMPHGWETGDPRAARAAYDPAVLGDVPDRVGQPAHLVAALPA